MKRVLRHSFRITRWTIACMIIVASLVLITARTLTSYIEDYTSNIVDRLSIVLGVPVEVDSVSAEWQGLGPSVFLTGVRLGEGENTSSISSVIVKPDVVSSLLSWGIIWSRFEVSEMDAYLEELPSGRWAFAGIPLGGGGGGGYIEEMILESNRVSVQQAKFNIRTLIGNQLELNVHDISLDYALAFHRLKLEADFGETNNRLEFIAELTGTGSRFLDLDGLAYLKIDGSDIGNLYTGIKDEFWPGVDLKMDEAPTAQIELWANFRSDKQIEWQGTAELDRVPAKLLGYESGSLRFLADLTGGYSAQSQFFNVQNSEVELYSGTIELPDLRLNRSLGVSEVDYSLTLPSIQVSELPGLVSDLPVLTDAGFGKVFDLNPVGEIELLRFDVPNLDFSRWQLSGHLESVDVESFRTAPAVKNLSGYFALQSNGGSMHVDAKNMSLFYPKVYDHWIEHDSVEGKVSWQIDFENKNLFVFADSVSVLGEHGPVTGAFLADIPLKLNHPAGVDLTLFIGIQNTSAEQKNNLLPSALPKDLRNWLDKAVIAGDVPEAGFVYRGSTKRGQSARRTTQLRLHAVNGGLKYADRWPRVTGLNAEVWVSDGHVSGSAASGQLLSLELSDISVELDPIIKDGQKTNQLKVTSVAQGSSASFLDLIRNYQLRDYIGDSLDILDISGNTEVVINLQLPTRKNIKRDDIDIQVQANLLNNQLMLLGQNLQFDNMTGVLTYDNTGLHATAVRAKLWNRPLELDLAEDLDAGLLGMDVQGAVEVKDVTDWLELSFLNRLEGVTGVTGRVEIETSSNRTGGKYHFWTDMRGVSSVFPEPFSKSADESAPLDIKVELGEVIVTSLGWDVIEGDNLAIASKKGQLEQDMSEPNDFLFEMRQYSQTSLTERLKPELTVKTEPAIQKEPRAEIFHSARMSFQSPLPEVREGIFSGQINVADINIDEYFEVYESEVEAFVLNNEAAENKTDVYGTILGLKPDLALATNSFVYGGINFGGVRANLGYEPNTWKINLEAGYGSGSLTIFEDKQPPMANVTSVDLNQIESLFGSDEGGRNDNTYSGEDKSLFDPRDIPHLQVNVESLTLDNVERGYWSGTLAPTENGLWIGDLTGGFGSALLAEEGSSTVFWGLDSNGYYTELDLTFEYGDVADLFRLMDIDSPMNSDRGIFYTSLNWEGAPYKFSASEANGIMGINAQNGSFHTSDSKVPNTLLKTIGFINVGSWVRRLRLDFNDMTASGTPYNLIVGDFVVEGNQITTLTPVDIELSSGSMRFDGAIDMEKEEVDARLVVTLPARQNVTWVAALVAGLPAAAGVWLAGKIFDDELDSLSSVSYKVEGSLDDPKVSAERMFESTITK